MNKKGFVINLTAQLAVLISNLIINFVLTPYVIQHLGEEAYGYIGLINNFVSYVTVITVALNSLAGRFITISFHKGEKKVANEYFTSVFYANIFMSFLVAIASFILLINATRWLKVPELLSKDVKVTIVFSAINTIISLLTVVFGIAAFIRNKLFLNSISQMIGAFGRVIVIVCAFNFFKPHIWYFALGACVAALLTLFIQSRITKKECPELIINKAFFTIVRIKEIVKIGVWASIESLNKILQTGLDLLIANIFINPFATGILSIAKTVPNILIQLTTTIASVFSPELALLYASGKKTELIQQFKYTMKILSLLMIVPLVGFMVFGESFYALWLKGREVEDIKLIQTLSVLTVFPLLINAYVEGLYYANTLTNRIRGSVLYTLFFSVASIMTEVILLKSTQIEPLYVIAGTSSVFMTLRYLIVTPLYCANVLNVPWFTFYPSLIRSIIISIILFAFYYCISNVIYIHTWLVFIGVIASSGLIGYLFVVFTLLSPEERKRFTSFIKKRFRKGT